MNAQLTITDSLDAPTLTTLLQGLNITVSNLVVNCAGASYGQFSGTSEIPITNGLVLSTGQADAVAGPVGNWASSDMMTPGDADLDSLVTVATYDACVLEFDCLPLGDTLMFNFSFGSEEYPEYVGAFNDVFAIWLTGPGFPIPTNVAAIPGGTPVSINNVNSTTNAGYYVDNEAIPGVDCAYDGFTQNLTAFAVVTPGSSYHFKVAVADASDMVFDSGVFLEAFSFRSVMGPLATAMAEAASNNALLITDRDGSLDVRMPTGHSNMQGRIIDMMGRSVRTFNLSGNGASVSTEGFRTGCYVVEVMDAQGSFHRTFYKD
jgi:hypothetical protein